MLSTRSFPRAIVHFDADSFFASVEQSLDHTLRGKVVVTGGERGAATSVSIEGKKMGLYRGMTLQEMKKICPDVVIVAGDYTAYSIYAKRMYHIAREFTPDVEEYSIDECFADITGLRTKYRTSYEGIAQMIQERLHTELGITFGVGLGPNKAIAKIASKYHKPAGFTAIPGKDIHKYLKEIAIGDIWGVGFSTSLYLEKLGVKTALDFALKDEAWLTQNKMSKPYRDIWLELRGHFIRKLKTDEDELMGSILQSRTFTPTADRQIILSALAKNIEGACAKARRHGVKAKICRFYLKTQEFRYAGKNLNMSIPLSDPREFLRLVEEHFNSVYIVGTVYRATGFGLYSVVPDSAIMPDLFGDSARVAGESPLLGAMDKLNKKYGRHTLYLGTSANAI
ncbi:MAG: polymerase, partial [Parcubacteria group bacterium]|nr:polymerase [Parcubacteria group bacterium]